MFIFSDFSIPDSSDFLKTLIPEELTDRSLKLSSLQLLENLKGFRIASLNIASLTKYIDQLRGYLVNKPVDIFCINESRLDSTVSDDAVRLLGYSIIRRDRFRTGGGVEIYVRDVLNVREWSSLVPNAMEAICIEVTKTKAKPILITSIYRPPDSKIVYMYMLEDYFNKLDNESKELIVLGDLNCDLSVEKLDNNSQRLTDLFNVNQMAQLITEPTRITKNHESLIRI